MAKRPVFFTKQRVPFYSEEIVTFDFNPGFADVQKQRNIRNIQDAFTEKHPDARILEISSKSTEALGVQLSAFNLKVRIGDQDTSLESAFQAGKVFRDGGPYLDLLSQPPWVAKKDPRLRESGPIVGFIQDRQSFPTEPKTFFYDWLYVNAVAANVELAENLVKYNAFTDIEFNPERSINCQARSAAIFVSLVQAGLLEKALQNSENFKRTVYGESRSHEGNFEQQLSFF